MRLVKLPWGDWVNPAIVTCISLVDRDGAQWVGVKVGDQLLTGRRIPSDEDVQAEADEFVQFADNPSHRDRVALRAAEWKANARLVEEVAAIINGTADPYRSEP